MSLKPKRVKKTANNNLTNPLLEPDNYPARLVQVLDLGPRQNYFDKEKINHEIMLTYELVTEFMQDDKGESVEDKPLWLSEVINMVDLPTGMSPTEIYADAYKSKGKLVQRCKVFDPKGTLDFDLSQMVDLPCVVTVVQKKKQDGTLKNDIGGVTGIMKGMAVPELVNPPKVFSLEEPDLTILGSLPEWLQEKIKTNLEFNGSPLEAALSGRAPEAKAKPKTEPKVKLDVGAYHNDDRQLEDEDDAPW